MEKSPKKVPLDKNPNGLILGTPGSGKSFSAKREIVNVFLVTLDDIIICDPEAEYYPLVQRLGGQVIKISPTSNQYVNPMDINLNYSEDDSPLALKSDFILSLCELVVGGKNGLEPVEKTVIDRATRNVYRSYLADPKPENMPILGDLYEEVKRQPEPEAARIASALELYVSGSLNVFNHRTNVDIENRLVCFDIKELGKQLKKLGMLIIQDQVWNRVTQNRSEGRSTRYYMDEMHLLLKEEQTAAYTVEIWKRFRKWGGIPTGITQNVKDLLSSREVENIFENICYKGWMSNPLLKQRRLAHSQRFEMAQPEGVYDSFTPTLYRRKQSIAIPCPKRFQSEKSNKRSEYYNRKGIAMRDSFSALRKTMRVPGSTLRSARFFMGSRRNTPYPLEIRL